MADNGEGSRTPPKFVSGLGLALRAYEQQQQQPRTRPRSRAFHNEEDFERQHGVSIHTLRREWAQTAIQSKPVRPFLHSLTGGGEATVKRDGLVPKNQRNAEIEVTQASTNNNTDVFVAGPQVTKGFFGLGPIKPRREFVHVIGQSQDFFPDNDYQEYVRTGRISENDSVMHTGSIPPLRDAQPEDTGPKSFMLPMTPRTKEGASRYMSGMEGHGDAAEAEIKRKFNTRFGNE